MFETAELGRKVSKARFKTEALALREELLELQEDLRRSEAFRVVLLFGGVDGGGKSETVALLNEWMDPRWLLNNAYDQPTEEERQRPYFWRYWRDLPPRGRIGLFLSAWYSSPVLDRVQRTLDEASFLKRLERVVSFERALAADGSLILKFWMHLSREAQERRLTSLQNDPLTKARVSERDWEHWRLYDRFIEAAEQVIVRTNRGIAPWTIVEGSDPGYRGLTVAKSLRDELRATLAHRSRAGKGRSQPPKAHAKPKRSKQPAARAAERQSTVLDGLDMSLRLSKAAYQRRLPELQARLHRLHLQAKEAGISSILAFEGPDAAGKGGVIRRVYTALEPRNFQIHGIAAPTQEEKAQHYLWRFWRHLRGAGYVTFFDRSWYGRVLVERVEGFAGEAEWRRAYAEINEFEMQLIEHGIVLMKYWIHITKDEQLVRFKAREKTPYKRWKLTDEDWRNREKWTAYADAVHDMVQYTSTREAPWTLIEGNDKRHARIKVLESFSERLAAALESRPT